MMLGQKTSYIVEKNIGNGWAQVPMIRRTVRGQMVTKDEMWEFDTFEEAHAITQDDPQYRILCKTVTYEVVSW